MTVQTTVPVTASITPTQQQQGETANSNVNILSWILIAVLFLMMIKCSYPLIVLIDLLQYIHLHVYVVLTPLPYLYMQALSALKNVNFVFLPTLSSNPTDVTSANYYDFQPDTTFLGNCHPFFFFLVIFGSAYLIFMLLSAQCCKIKSIRSRVKKIYRGRMRYSFLH